MMRNDWKLEEVKEIYDTGLMELISKSHGVHSLHHKVGEIQVCSLISFKTGGCPENCKYCPQSSHYQTGLMPQPLMNHDEIMKMAKNAIKEGATRICIGAAWREPKKGKAFDTLLKAIKEITALNVEVCCTLGMLTAEMAQKLKEAGLYAYNHNLDSSASFYKTIITTRTYESRLNTLDEVEKAGISVCCGGILGMGETHDDRIGLIHTLATRAKHPESVPFNFLLPIKGTPLAEQPKVPIWDMLRMIATARIVMPKSIIRLSCGRLQRSLEEQFLCFFAGANSIHMGEKLLTTPNTSIDEDQKMFSLFGLKKRKAFHVPF